PRSPLAQRSVLGQRGQRRAPPHHHSRAHGARVIARVRRPVLTGQAEDYLKAIYELERDGRPASTKPLATRLGIAAPSVTGMLRRLGRQGLVATERYHGSHLTPHGKRLALQLLRRH